MIVPSNAFMIYVMEKDALDKQHNALYKAIVKIADECADGAKLDQAAGRLSEFISILREHHIAEARMLSAIQPEGWEGHIAIHQNIEDAAAKILSQALIDGIFESNKLRELLNKLERHVATLDSELWTAIDREKQQPYGEQ